MLRFLPQKANLQMVSDINGVHNVQSSWLYDGRCILGIMPEGDGEYREIAIDMASGETSELTITYQEDNYTVHPMILAELENEFLVISGSQELSVPFYAKDGTAQNTTASVLTYSLITKANYWSNRPNYIAIEDYVLR